MRGGTARRIVVLVCMLVQAVVTAMGGALVFGEPSSPPSEEARPAVIVVEPLDGRAGDPVADMVDDVSSEVPDADVADEAVVSSGTEDENDGTVRSVPAAIPPEETMGFGRDLLDSSLRPAYDQVLAGLVSGETSVHVECSINDIEAVVHAVCDDHPEIMRLRGSWSVCESPDGGVDAEPDLTMTFEEERDLLARCDEALSGMVVVGESEHDTAWSVYEGLCARCEYDLSYVSDQGMGGVLTHGHGVCAGYARAFQRAMHLCGIRCGVVRGTVRGESHMWDVAMLDGVWCVIDPTWGDGALEGDGTDVGRARPEYFGMTDEEAARLGYVVASSAPACTSSAQDHVERCGWKLAWPDEEELSRVFWEQCATGMVVTKFMDDASYAEAARMADDGSFMRRDLTELATERGNGNLRYGWRTDDALRVVEVIIDM